MTLLMTPPAISICRDEEAWTMLDRLQNKACEPDPETIQSVSEIVEAVRQEGDAAVRRLAEQFGDFCPERLIMSEAEVEAAVARVPEDTRALLQRAAARIRTFAEAVMRSTQPFILKDGPLQTGLEWRPVDRAACYVPGGRFPLPSTALMTAITAQTAGVREVILVSPDMRDETVYAGTLAGVRTFLRVGGAQAVAALAYGTEEIAAVDMLVGPGNRYVTEAKRQLQGIIGIDMLAGPSEVAIIADAGANPAWVAADLLAQAEHDPAARAYLLTDSETLAEATVRELARHLAEQPELPSHLTASTDWGCVLLLPDLSACVQAANRIAPEHLELLVRKPEQLKPRLRHYGALFMGDVTSVPVGDYMAGPNHTLPTARSARFSGMLSPMTFLRPQSWIRMDADGAETLLTDTVRFAELEGLSAHALSAGSRLADKKIL